MFTHIYYYDTDVSADRMFILLISNKKKRCFIVNLSTNVESMCRINKGVPEKSCQINMVTL